MKKFFLSVLIITALAACKKNAATPTTTELQLTASDISNEYAAGKSINFFTVNGSLTGPVQAPSPGQNQTWDYSSLTADGTLTDACTATTSTTFSPNGYFLPSSVVYADGSAQTLQAEAQVGDSGWVRGGASLPAFSLNFPAYGATIDYSAQDSKYSSPLPITTPFPVKYNDTGSYSNIVRTENFTINAAAFGLNATPGAQTYTNSGSIQCMASGTLKLPGFSGAMNVLVLKSHRTLVYHYFVGGAPAPAELLNTLGIIDGEAYGYYWYDFYNPGGEGYLGTINVNQDGTVINAYFKSK